MPAPQLSDEEHQRRYDAFLQHGSVTATAKALGLNKDAISRSKKWAAKKGLTSIKPVMDGFEITKVSTAENKYGDIERTFVQQKPEKESEYEIDPLFVRGATTTQVDGEGRIVQAWLKDKRGELDPYLAKEIVRSSLDGFKGIAKPKKKPKGLRNDGMMWLPISDLHLGACYRSNDKKLRWGTKDTLIDVRNCIEELIDEATPSERAVIQALGDICDFDGLEPVTPKSKHVLETDLSASEMMEEAMTLFHWAVDLCLQKFGEVHFSMVRGNHDLVLTQSIKAYIMGVYLNEPRVTVDLSDDMHTSHKWGKHFIFATHADEMKPQQIPSFMSTNYRKEWGEAGICWAYCGHRHKYVKLGEDSGVIVEQAPAIVRGNRYARGHGFDSLRGMHAATFFKNGGIDQSRKFFI